MGTSEILNPIQICLEFLMEVCKFYTQFFSCDKKFRINIIKLVTFLCILRKRHTIRNLITATVGKILLNENVQINNLRWL